MKFYHLRHISRIGHDHGLGLHDAVKDETLNELTWKQGQTMGRSTTPPIPKNGNYQKTIIHLLSSGSRT